MADRCVIGVLSDDADWIHPVGLDHVSPGPRQDINEREGLSWRPVRGPCRQVLDDNRAAVLSAEELGEWAQEHPWADALSVDPHIRCGLIAPMRSVGATVGVLTMTRSPPRAGFDEREVTIAQHVADQLGLAVSVLSLRPEPHLGARDAGELANLSDRQREVLKLVGEGLSSREVAERLVLSVRTVEWHRSRLMAQLQISGRSELIARARSLRP